MDNQRTKHKCSSLVSCPKKENNINLKFQLMEAFHCFLGWSISRRCLCCNFSLVHLGFSSSSSLYGLIVFHFLISLNALCESLKRPKTQID